MLLESQAALNEGIAALTARDPVMARLAREGVCPPLRKRDPGLPGLVAIVVSQQVSVASAAAIWRRVEAALPKMDAAALDAAGDEILRQAGLSGPKIRTLRAVAAAILENRLPLDSLPMLEADAAHGLLTGVKGIGPWTASIYLLFCLGHRDAFPSGDLALQEAARMANGLADRPDAAALARLAEAWRPWRGVAAGMLWAYYAQAKARPGAPIG